MTEPKNEMPDVIWAGVRTCCYSDVYFPFEHKSLEDDTKATKYLRAEPVEALLKQALTALKTCGELRSATDSMLWYDADLTDAAITAIDKFLEGKE